MEEITLLYKEIEQIIKNAKPSKSPYKMTKKANRKVTNALTDIDVNRNHSWAVEMFVRNRSNLDKIAVQYRGNEMSYRSVFEQAYGFAKSLKAIGYVKGDQIPICITNIPEFVYLFLAASYIGAVVNVVGEWFSEDYLIEIINNTNSKYIFVDDLYFGDIIQAVERSNVEDVIMFSLQDSLPKDKEDKPYNPFEKLEGKKHTFQNNIDKHKKTLSKKIYTKSNFVKMGQDYAEKVGEERDLDEPCTITYTSGTTKPGYPKGVIHSNRSYISLARFYESDVSGMPTMKNMKFLGQISTYTHMSLSCGISDTLYCGCTYDCEPFYEKEFFPYSLKINKSNFVTASAGFWVYFAKLLNGNNKWKNEDLSNLMLPTVTGEGLSKGEEYYLNYTAKKHKFGINKLPYPIAPATFSIGGGTTEGTGIFVTLFKHLLEKIPTNYSRDGGLGLTPMKFAEISVLDKDGKYCDIRKPGLLVEKSPCEMIGYTDETLNKNIRVTDYIGREWLSLGTFGYISDKKGRIKMKGRMNDYIHLKNGQDLPVYEIEDFILSDYKKVMSCSAVHPKDNPEMIVCHVEFQPNGKQSDNAKTDELIKRVREHFSDEVLEKLYIRVRDNKTSFPLDPSGKRSIITLVNEGISDDCIKV